MEGSFRLQLVLALVVIELNSMIALHLVSAQKLVSDEKVLGHHDEIIGQVEDASHFLQHAAQAVHGSVDDCTSRMYEVTLLLNTAQTSLLQEDFSLATTQLDVAKEEISDCQHALQQGNDPSGQPKAFLLEKAVSLLETAMASISKLQQQSVATDDQGVQEAYGSESNTVETEWRISASCKSDGTICQFSSCARGKMLPKCAFGFASGVTGGAAGPIYTVTRSDDNPYSPQPGSLRYVVGLGGGQRGGVWITFSNSMIIVLRAMLWIRSHTTIDGRGFNITLNGRMIVVGGVTNVILHNFQINSMDESDTIHIFAGSSRVWVDHVTSFDAKLGLISVVQRATDVTISNCRLSNHNFNMLLGASDADLFDRNLRVTVYRNWFKDSMQRMPHCRWGYCHVINNLYTNWGYYTVGGRVHATILSESNVFMASRRSEATPWFPGAGNELDTTPIIQSKNDLLLNGSTFHQFLQMRKVAMPPRYKNSASYPPVHPVRKLPDLIRNCGGAIFGLQLQKCLHSGY